MRSGTARPKGNWPRDFPSLTCTGSGCCPDSSTCTCMAAAALRSQRDRETTPGAPRSFIATTAARASWPAWSPRRSPDSRSGPPCWPGAAGAVLDRDEVTCELIADGVHLHDTTIRLAARAAGPGRLVLITDAMAAAGMPDGSYRLGSVQVNVAGGVARLAGHTGPAGDTGTAGHTGTA